MRIATSRHDADSYRARAASPARRSLVAVVSIHVALLAITVDAQGTDPRLDFFERRIRPVLVEHCYACHSADAAARGKLKAALALDTRQGLLKGGESGPAIVPGKPADSLLIEALKHEGLEMPPSGKLPTAVIADFEAWIAAGAVDPRAGTVASVKRGMSIDEGRKFWSFVPPQDPPEPAVKRQDWPRGGIDRFVLARLEQQGLQPLADADARTLLRRLYFDLIGLPPTAEDLARCETDHLAERDVYDTLVDRLLASPHFGERWGRHWLDAARYADSNGRDRNVYFYHAWRYRDYAIVSFNHDKPFDRFVREQIAGDLLPAASRAERDQQRIATGFLALGSKAYEEQKPEVFRMDVVDEQIEVVGRAILGLSVGCARCHDHKFDPIPTADYYALAGIFRSTQTLSGYGPKGIKSNVHAHSELLAVGPDAERLGPQGLAYLAHLQELTLAQNTARSDRYRVVRRVADARLKLAVHDADKPKLEADIAQMEAEIKDWDVKVKAAEAALQAAMDTPPAQPGWAMAMRDRQQVEDCRIHIRGDTANLGDVVPRGVLQVMSLPAGRPVSDSQSGRLELAEWLTGRDNPLTARVFVNRVWLHLFGRGLVATPDDFGVNGARPSHPELLDYLTVRFMQDGWSTKRLVRSIVLSRTYRQSSNDPVGTAEAPSPFAKQFESDPENVYLWRMQPRRLEAEVLRDAIMSVAGTLDPSPPPADRGFLARYNPYREDEYRTFKPLFLPANVEHANRSVYLPVVRGVLPEVFQLFDFASPDRSTAQREESTVPAQSLYFMNNPWVIGQSRHLADQLLADSALDEAGRVASLYRRAFSREPTAAEVNRALQYLSSPELLQANSQAQTLPTAGQLRIERWTSFCQAVFASAEFRYLR